MGGKGGRPSAYKPEYNEQARKLCLLGYIDKELADFFNVTETTINNWKNSKPGFFESLKKGKELADAEVTQKLFERACGYEHREDKIFCNAQGEVTIQPTTKHYPPDPTAAIYWLKNRQRDRWGDKKEDISEALEKLDKILDGIDATME